MRWPGINSYFRIAGRTVRIATQAIEHTLLTFCWINNASSSQGHLGPRKCHYVIGRIAIKYDQISILTVGNATRRCGETQPLGRRGGECCQNLPKGQARATLRAFGAESVMFLMVKTW